MDACSKWPLSLARFIFAIVAFSNSPNIPGSFLSVQHICPYTLCPDGRNTQSAIHTKKPQNSISPPPRPAHDKNPLTWLRSDAFEERDLSSVLTHWKRIFRAPFALQELGLHTAKTYMLDRIEEDGTLYSYASATIFMVYSLLSLGVSRHSPVIRRAINGIKALVTECGRIPYLENSTSTVWDTALITYALQQNGVAETDGTITKAASFLQKRQHTKIADWSVKNPNVSPGGWGFSNINTNNPDCDDTAAVLKVIPRNFSPSSWERGVAWLYRCRTMMEGFPPLKKCEPPSYPPPPA